MSDKIEAAVYRSDVFGAVSNCIANRELDRAIDLLADLKKRFADDPHSLTAIDRRLSDVLAESGREDEALALLLSLGPALSESGCDMSVHHTAVVSLLTRMRRLESLRDYCATIPSNPGPNPLGHLEWIHIYAKCDNTITQSIRELLEQCASQLGAPKPTLGQRANDLIAIVEDLVTASEEANERFGGFLERLEEAHNNEATAVEIRSLVEEFAAAELSPMFRRFAFDAIESEEP